MISLLCFGLGFVLAGQSVSTGPSLYAIENINTPGEGVNSRALVRITFGENQQLKKETILSKDQRFFGHFGRHRIVEDRFVVTQYGGVIEIPSGKLLNDEQYGEFLGTEPGKVIYKKGKDQDKPVIFAFDLQNAKLEKVQSPSHWELPGTKSPDLTRSIEQPFPGKFILHQLGKPPVDLPCNLGFTYSEEASPALNGHPFLWLDNDRILTIQDNHQLVTMTPQGKVEPLFEILTVPRKVITPPQLKKDPLGQIIYTCGNKHFQIDVDKKTDKPLKTFAWGQGFLSSVDTDNRTRRVISQDGKAIGKWVCNSLEVAPGLAALAYVKPRTNANLGAPEGVAIWNRKITQWQTIDFWVNDLVGWAK